MAGRALHLEWSRHSGLGPGSLRDRHLEELLVWESGLSKALDPRLARAAHMFDSQKHHDPGALIGLLYSGTAHMNA